VVAAAVASEQVILGTSKGYLLRYYWDEAGNERGARPTHPLCDRAPA
jgi:hypothetical protein